MKKVKNNKKPTRKEMESAILFALSTVPSDKLIELFANFGYKSDEISVSSTFDAIKTYGKEFSQPFAKLALDVLHDSDKMEEVRNYYMLSRADGEQAGEGEGDGEGEKDKPSFDDVMNGGDRIFSWLDKGFNYYDIIANGGNNNGNANQGGNNNQSGNNNQPETPTQENNQQSKMLLYVGIGAGVLVVALILIVTLRKK